jgi:hypothetical protein
MIKVIYQETEKEHAARIGRPTRDVRVRRRLLIARLGGARLAGRRNDRIPDGLLNATAVTLMAELAVRIVRTAGPARRRGQAILLVPETGGVTEGSNRRQVLAVVCMAGAEPPPQRRPNPPYVYRRGADGGLVSDPQAGPAVKLAFSLIRAYADQTGRVSWTAVAETLNSRGYLRRGRQPWRGDDVRALTEVTTYAGYALREGRSAGEAAGEIARAAEIARPLVDLPTFLRAAQMGRGRHTGWLHQLEALAAVPEIAHAELPAHGLAPAIL